MQNVKRASGTCLALVFTVLIAASAVAQGPVSRLDARETVWIWSNRCANDHRLDVTVRIGSKVLDHAILPICQGNRDAEDGRLSFHISGSELHRHGYSRRSSDSIEADLWQAGGDPDALILGFSLESTGQIHLNTLHIAKPDAKVSSDFGRGLTITTFPVAGK
jgi:hypothetical protein